MRYLYKLLQKAKLERQGHVRAIRELKERLAVEQQRNAALLEQAEADKASFTAIIRADREKFERRLAKAERGIVAKDRDMALVMEWAQEKQRMLVQQAAGLQGELQRAKQETCELAGQYNQELSAEMQELQVSRRWGLVDRSVTHSTEPA